MYGSVARREDNKNSDIDILIVSQDKVRTKNKVAEQVSETLLNAGIYISAKAIFANEYQKLKSTHFISQIEKEGLALEAGIEFCPHKEKVVKSNGQKN